MTDLTWRQRASLQILFFILRVLNPTGYEHQVKDLRRRVMEEEDHD